DLALNALSGSVAPGLNYHYRIVLTNAAGRVFGADRLLRLPSLHPPGDTDGDNIISQTELDTVLANYWPHTPWLQMTNAAGRGSSDVTFALSNNSTAGAFSVEYTTDLANWFPLGPATPRYLFTDTNAPASPRRYYRLRYQ
ncbi:MAG TPA: hypothetical protein VK615_05875, partial [Candidatus Binatia bacterium]|nr:hypothetical protein [Candidatus Binatia bacterium]